MAVPRRCLRCRLADMERLIGSIQEAFGAYPLLSKLAIVVYRDFTNSTPRPPQDDWRISFAHRSPEELEKAMQQREHNSEEDRHQLRLRQRRSAGLSRQLDSPAIRCDAALRWFPSAPAGSSRMHYRDPGPGPCAHGLSRFGPRHEDGQNHGHRHDACDHVGRLYTNRCFVACAR